MERVIYVAFVCGTPIALTGNHFLKFVSDADDGGIHGNCIGAFTNVHAAKAAVEKESRSTNAREVKWLWPAERDHRNVLCQSFYEDGGRGIQWLKDGVVYGWIEPVPLERRVSERRRV